MYTHTAVDELNIRASEFSSREAAVVTLQIAETTLVPASQTTERPKSRYFGFKYLQAQYNVPLTKYSTYYITTRWEILMARARAYSVSLFTRQKRARWSPWPARKGLLTIIWIPIHSDCF